MAASSFRKLLNPSISNLIFFLNICRIILCAFAYFAATCSHESIPYVLCQAFNTVRWFFLKCSSWDSGPSQVRWRKIHNINYYISATDKNLLLRASNGGFDIPTYIIPIFIRPNSGCWIVCNDCEILELKIIIQIVHCSILGPGSRSDWDISL